MCDNRINALDDLNPEFFNLSLNHKTNQKDIVVIIAYLIGVKAEHIENNYGDEKELLDKLESNSTASIIRALCSIRTTLIVNYEKVANDMQYNLCNIDRQKKFEDDINVLAKHNVSIVKPNGKAYEYFDVINSLLKSEISKMRDWFPEWIQWSFIEQLFIMPKTKKVQASKAYATEANKFRYNRYDYPYACYINWEPQKGQGNILISNKRFVCALYEQYGEEFKDFGKVSDASQNVKTNIYDFLEKNENVEIFVDCENSDPFKLAAMIKQLDSEKTKKIKRIVLYDDIHTTKIWKSFESYLMIPIVYKEITRVKNNKSLVDIKMGMGISEAYFTNSSRAFILLSSDSDFWGVISSLPDAEFLVMLESKKSGEDIRRALKENGTYFCFLDDFSTGNLKDFKNTILREELNNQIGNLVNIDVNDLINSIFTEVRMKNVTIAEKEAFYEKYIKKLTLKIDKNRHISINIPE